MRPADTAKRLSDLLFAPRAIAIIGASGDPAKVSSRPLRYLRANGFSGQIMPVNPRGGEIDGVAVATCIADLPDVPDHAFIVLGNDPALDALAECVALGVPVVSILADGFADAGAAGAARQTRLEAILSGSRTRLLGPNCMGLANPSIGLTLTANASFAVAPRHPGGFMLASQSGSMIGTLLSRGGARGIGFSRMIETGNEADLDVAEVCLACVDDPGVTGFLLFLETIRSAANLSALAHAAHGAGKPVIAYKMGRSELGQALAVTHTGAMMAEDDLADACLRGLGIARVHHLEAFFEAIPLFARPGLARTRRVGVVTTTGGGAAMVADQLGVLGVEVTPASPESRAALQSAGIAAHDGPVTDLTLAGARPETLAAAVGVLTRDLEFGLLVVVLGSSAAAEPERMIPPVLAHAGGALPLAVFVVPDAPRALDMCAQAGVAAFRTPEACADAVAAWIKRRAPRLRIAQPQAQVGGRTLSETESLARLEALGIAGAPRIEATVGDLPAVLPFGWPVVAKAVVPGLSHKSDVGGVVLNLRDRDELARAVTRISEDVGNATGQTVTRVQIAEQMRPLAELLIGYRVDPVFGPVVLLSQGGVAAELATERSVRLAPVDIDTAKEMIEALSVSRLLRGYRNVPAGDVQAVAETIARLSDPGADVTEAEINPLCVTPDGAFALDGLMVLRENQ